MPSRAIETSRSAHTRSSVRRPPGHGRLDDPRFVDNPVVVGPIRVRFYAGVPLALADGSRVGTLCVADHRPRRLDDEQLEALSRLADLVVAELQAPT